MYGQTPAPTITGRVPLTPRAAFFAKMPSRVVVLMGRRPRRYSTTNDGREEHISRNPSPWFSLGYLLAIAVIVFLIVLLILWIV
jgi:hypothetical protein